jgi:hypothetical protein
VQDQEIDRNHIAKMIRVFRGDEKLFLLSPDGPAQVGFDMDTYLSSNPAWNQNPHVHECGTVACIAGTAMILQRIEVAGPLTHEMALAMSYGHAEVHAKYYMGLPDLETADVMFHTYTDPMGRPYTSEDAADMLERYLDTGLVSWPENAREVPDPRA